MIEYFILFIINIIIFLILTKFILKNFEYIFFGIG